MEGGRRKDPFNELLLSTRNSRGADLDGNSVNEVSLKATGGAAASAPPPPTPSNMQESLLVLGMGCLILLKTGKLDPTLERERS